MECYLYQSGRQPIDYLTKFNFSYHEQDTFITGTDQTSFFFLVSLYNALLSF
jgi:hypothetical protein